MTRSSLQFNYDQPFCPLTDGEAFLNVGRKFYYRKGSKYIERIEPPTIEEERAPWSQHDFVLLHLFGMKLMPWFAWPEQHALDRASSAVVIETHWNYARMWDMETQGDSNDLLFEALNPNPLTSGVALQIRGHAF